MADAKSKLTRDTEAAKSTGARPSIAGASAYRGYDEMVAPLIGVPAALISSATDKSLTGKVPHQYWGYPIEYIPSFAPDKIKKIRRFAKEKGLGNVPIVGGPNAALVEEIEIDSLRDEIKDRVLPGLKQPKSRHIRLPTDDVRSAFHEITHASDPLKSKRLQRVARMASNFPEGVLGKMVRAGGMVPALLVSEEGDSDIQKALHKASPYIVGATYAPQVAEEARANIGSLVGAKRYKELTPKSVLSTIAAQTTYLAKPIAAILGTILARNVVDKLHENSTKEAAAMPGNEMRQSGLKKLTDTAAWYQNKPPKPKSINPKGGGQAKEMAVAKPPSSNKFYKDMLQALYQPELGFRQSVA